MEERWSAIAGFDNYEVSTLGRIRSYANNTHSGGKDALPHIVKPYKSARANRVMLCRLGERKTFLVRRLVAEAFVPNPQSLPQVLTINENRFDDRASNLRWGTPNEAQNRAHTVAKRYYHKIYHQVKCVETNTIYQSVAEAGRKSPLSRSSVWLLCNGKRESIKGLHFKYV